MVAVQRTKGRGLISVSFGLALVAAATCGLFSSRLQATPAKSVPPAKAKSQRPNSSAAPTVQITAEKADEARRSSEPQATPKIQASSHPESVFTETYPTVPNDEIDASAPLPQKHWWNSKLQLGLVIALVLAVLAFLFVWLYRPNRADNRHRQRKSGPMVTSSGNYGLAGQQTGSRAEEAAGGSIAELTAMVARLSDEINRLSKRLLVVEELNNRSSSYGVARAPSPPDGPYPAINRKADAVVLPEDTYTAKPTELPGYTNQSNSYSAPYADARSLSAAGLVGSYNEAVKPNDLAALADKVRAEYYTNERSGDISSLLRSEIDRFWLVPQPHQTDTAWLIPGFAVRKAWQKFRQAASDHPLAHHFELLRGDKFVVNRAAVVRKDANGEWQLVSKGEVSGIS